MALDLAVVSDGPTRRRLRRHLPAHGIAVHHLEVGAGLTDLTEPVSADQTRYDVGLVYPPRTTAGAVITARLKLPWVNDRSAIRTTRNKAGSLAQLAGASIPIPRTIHAASPVDVEDLLDAARTIEGPVVIKPNATTRGTGHVLVHDEDSLRGVVDYLDLVHAFPATADRSFLLQAYYPEARDLRLTVIDGTVAGAVERVLPDDAGEGDWVKNVHRGATATAIDPPASVVDLAERAAEVLSVPLLGVDILLTADGPLVLEVNGRPTIDRIEKYPSDFYDRLASLIERTA